MKLGQVKVPELALDAFMGYWGTQIDHPSHGGPSDSYHQGSTPDLIPGVIMGGLHGAVGLSGLIGAAAAADGGKSDAAKNRAVQGLWELVKGGGFAVQIAPSLGMVGAGMIACGTLGDVCSGWVTQPFHDWADGRKATKAKGPQGCAGPED